MSKLTEDDEEGFGCDTERSALGGREVAGTGRRGAEDVVGWVEESVEDEYEYPGKLPGTLCLRRLVAGSAGVDVDPEALTLRGGSS